MTTASFSIGSLVRARGREWVVLPESEPDFLVLRPLGGIEDEVAGVCTAIEAVEPASFDLPDPGQVGDHRSCRLLRDAVRLGSRASAGPFRSFARIAVEPRPYQLVPLLMALRLDTVRLLIADDVGIGKSVEAALIARELLDRGEVQRLAVLCPPHLAEQWQLELLSKFHIEAELVLAGTARRLERGCRVGESLFDRHRFVVVSTDFIKSDSRRGDFVRACPELVIVDEAHTCAFGADARGGRHQRHQLIRELAADQARHVILVTATPHSGNEEAFHSLLTLLRPDFADLPADLTGKANEAHRRRLAAHLIQRRRADIRHFLSTDTPFPERREREETYALSPAYRKLFDRVLAYARETVREDGSGRHRQRVRWWSALALLRSLASSPAAAAETLRNRAAVADTASEAQADAVGCRTVFDDDVDELGEVVDLAPGADARTAEEDPAKPDRRLLELAREADTLGGKADAKLTRAAALVREILDDGFHPIVFCRFIPTAEYVAEHLRRALPRGTAVESVTGRLAPAEREARIAALAQQRGDGKRIVLVCTDCLSEGINLQDHFDAVVHYDLAWNPTRHEQREGRVDRYGQPRAEVRMLTYYGADNPIDGIVLDVLLRKHRTIRTTLGVSVPVPLDTNKIVEAVFEGLLLREGSGIGAQGLLPGLEAHLRPQKQDLHAQWDSAADREKRSRTVFAQESIHVDEVARELDEARQAAGSAETVRTFAIDALRASKATVQEDGAAVAIDLSGAPPALRELPGVPARFTGRFELPVDDGVVYLARTQPFIEALASHVMEGALDPQLEGVAARAGVIRTRAVARRTTVLLLRFRFDITTTSGGRTDAQLAEECGLLAFEGAPANPTWLPLDAAEGLLTAVPAANVLVEQASEFVARVRDGFASLQPAVDAEAGRRAAALLESHQRVRQAARVRGVSHRVTPQLPVDVLGIYVYLPAA